MEIFLGARGETVATKDTNQNIYDIMIILFADWLNINGDEAKNASFGQKKKNTS